MIINLYNANIFKTEAEAIVNPVNCVGVMGKGLAFEFNRKFPQASEYYMEQAGAGKITPGNVYLAHNKNSPKYIIHFPTKQHWKDRSRLEDIASGLESLRKTISDYKIKSVAIPPIGCGLGKLNWNVVKTLIEQTFQDSSAEIYILNPPSWRR